MKTNFKVLMYNGLPEYIDANLLDKGIYGTNKPILFNSDDTIESLVKNAESMKSMKDKIGNGFVTESYLTNLKRCKLVTVSLNILK